VENVGLTLILESERKLKSHFEFLKTYIVVLRAQL